MEDRLLELLLRFNRLFTRGDAALKMIRKFSECGLNGLVNNSFSEFSNPNPNQISALDLYDRSIDDARSILASGNIEWRPVPLESADEACAFKNLRQMHWTILQGDKLKLLTYNNKVVSIQVDSNDRRG
jgi:hypothetical protein